MNQPNWVHPNTAQATQGAYNQGAAPHAPYLYALGYQYHLQGAYPVVMPPPPQPAPKRKRGFFMACFEAVFCCCLKNTNLGDVNGGDGCICGDCFARCG